MHICFGYAAIIHERPEGYSFLPELADSPIRYVSIETAQSGLDLGVLADLADKTIILGVIDLSTPEVETAQVVADRVRRAFQYLPPEQVVIATDCGMKYLPRESANGKMRAMSEAAAHAAGRDPMTHPTQEHPNADGHRGQHHRARRAAMGDGPRPAAGRDPDGSLVRHLHDFAREVRLTEAEWMAAIQWLTKHRPESRRQAARSSSSPPTSSACPCWSCR